MLVPFGAIPSHLLEPLHVDTGLQYNLRKLKIPKTSESRFENALFLAPFLQEPPRSDSDYPFGFSLCGNHFELEGCSPGQGSSDFEVILSNSDELDSVFSGTPSEINEDRWNFGKCNANCDWPSCLFTSYPACETGTCSTETVSQDNTPRHDSQNTSKESNTENARLEYLRDRYLGVPLQFCEKVHKTQDFQADRFIADSIGVREEEIDSFFAKPIESEDLSTQTVSSDSDVITYANLTTLPIFGKQLPLEN